jgi:hypothetical protein
MDFAYALPAPVTVSLRVPLGARIAAALVTLAAAGAAAGLLLPHSAAPTNTTVLTPVSTTVAPR